MIPREAKAHTSRHLALVLSVSIAHAHSHAEFFNAEGELTREPTQTSILLQPRVAATSVPETNKKLVSSA